MKKNDKNLTPQQTKPSMILELEKFYNITLRQKTDEMDLSITIDLRSNYFGVNDMNEIVMLSINLLGSHLKDLSPFKDLNDLRYLSLIGNEIEDISSIYPNPNLEYLDLRFNKIKDISVLGCFTQLKTLGVSDCPTEDVSALKCLINLQELYCTSMRIKSIQFISSLRKLKVIDVSHNDISDIGVLEEHEELTAISLNYNNVKIIPTEIATKFDWLNHERNDSRRISLKGNPLEYPPRSVVELGRDTIKNYYQTSDKYGHAPLSEGRIIVVGDGSAGKSSLIQRVLHDEFEQGKSQTNGVFIEHWQLKHEDQRQLTFHIWDFGGQEIQHAVHKFFFTEGCLYVLVLDNRKEEEPEYWLQQIESLGGSAPVLIVFNKQDDNVTEIADRKFLKEKYPNIVGFHNTSCKTGAGIDDFKIELEKNVVKLRTVDELFPNNWFRIKKAIQERTSGEQHYLDYSTFRNICDANNANSEETQKLLLKYFTTIGAVTWFGDTYLNFLHVLSPKWITQGVYKIITSKKTAALSGSIKIEDFKELLRPLTEMDYTYNEEHYGYILSMMQKFDLCYTSDSQALLIPSAFGKVPKLEYSEFRGTEVRTYILQFKDYMPLALIHRFTAKKLPCAFDENYWYSGIVLKDSIGDSLAMVHADKEAKRIYIRIKGEEKLGLWEHIRRELDEIASSYAKISYEELVSLDDSSENTVAYDDLISHIKANKSQYFHSKLQKDYNVGY